MEEVNKGGRPLKWDPEQLAKDLVVWSKLESSENLNGFCADNDIPPSIITDYARADYQGFRAAYDLSKANLASRREKNLSTGSLHVKAYDLNAQVYDHFLKDDRRDQQRFESMLQAEIAKSGSEHLQDQFTALMTQLHLLQSDAKAAAKMAKKEAKSP